MQESLVWALGIWVSDSARKNRSTWHATTIEIARQSFVKCSSSHSPSYRTLQDRLPAKMHAVRFLLREGGGGSMSRRQ